MNKREIKPLPTPTPDAELATLQAKAQAFLKDETTFHATMADPDLTHEACVAIDEYLSSLLQDRLHRSPLSGIVLVNLGLNTLHDTVKNTPLKWILSQLTHMIIHIWGEHEVRASAEAALTDLSERLSPNRDPFELPTLGPRPKKDMIH